MLVDVVCEGSTDFAVLGVIVRAVFKDSAPIIRALQPDFDALRRDQATRKAAPKAGPKPIRTALAPGWTGLRAYLQSPASAIAADLSDVFVVQVDADVSRTIEKKLREPAPGEHVLDPLCQHVRSWFPAGPPASVVVVLPREATEAWLLAAQTNVADVEADPAPAATLVAKGLISGEERDPNKQRARYEELARPLVVLIADKKQLARVPELARFVDKLRSRAHALRRAKKARPAS